MLSDFPRTRAAWARLKAAWRDYWNARAEYRTVTTNMTAEQRAAFDRAFAKMDEAFDELDKVFRP